MSNYNDLKALVQKISGQAAVITVLRVYVDICDDLETAAVLSQCVFWSDKGRDGGGWFYKSRDEWRSELGIKRSTLESSVKRLKALGLIETKIKSGHHNAQTTYYRVNMECLTHVIVASLHGRLVEINQSNSRSAEINLSNSRSAGSNQAGIRLAETSQSDWLKSANPLVEINQSSYSSLQQSLRAEESADAPLTHQPARKRSKVAEPKDALLRHPAVIAYCEMMHLTPNPTQRQAIADAVGSNGQVDSWRAVLTEWQLSGYKASNVAGQLDRFKKAMSGQSDRPAQPGQPMTSGSPAREALKKIMQEQGYGNQD